MVEVLMSVRVMTVGVMSVGEITVYCNDFFSNWSVYIAHANKYSDEVSLFASIPLSTLVVP
jgi:hypothetical protein